MTGRGPGRAADTRIWGSDRSGRSGARGLPQLLEQLKTQVRQARVRASRVVNTELLTLHWDLGRTILDRQEAEGWGAKVIDRLADDLRAAFPEMRGLSRSNPEIHAPDGIDLATHSNQPTSCWLIALGASHSPARQAGHPA